jgi:uncharacterized protein (TIGR02145 family)
MKKIQATILSVSVSFLLVSAGCDKKSGPEPVSPVIPVVTTTAVAGITQATATSGGNATSDGGAPVTARGVCWDTAVNPGISGRHTVDGTGTGEFTSQLSGLEPNTSYYVRAYATNSAGTAYGSTLLFATLKIPVDSVTDADGNVYHAVTIGTQKWLRENLRVTRYRNGEAIPEVKGDAQWKIQAAGAYCTYDNLPANSTVYGALYNWHALVDSRGLCPQGWHVPSVSEWEKLGSFLGGLATAGGALKSTGTIEAGTGPWYAPNTGASNASGFSGLPGGYRINYGTFYSIGNVGYFWSVSDTATDNAWNYVLDANNAELKRIFNFKTNGFSVRCCKD